MLKASSGKRCLRGMDSGVKKTISNNNLSIAKKANITNSKINGRNAIATVSLFIKAYALIAINNALNR
jgi:hypothetical protein